MTESSDDPRSTPEPGSQSIPAKATRNCVACSESIQLEARTCPRCGTAQGGRHAASVGLRWAAGLITIATLGLGIQELGNRAAARFERSDVVQTRLRAADALLAQRAHAAAWELISSAQELSPDDASVKALRLRIATEWMNHGWVIGEDASMVDVADIVDPAFAEAVASSDPRTRSTGLGMLAGSSDARGPGAEGMDDVTSQLEQALAVDPDNALVALLLGQHLAGELRDLAAARPHLDHAIDLAREGQLDLAQTRIDQIWAVASAGSRFRRSNDNEDGRAVTFALIEIANDMRSRGEPVPIDSWAWTPQSQRNVWEVIAGGYKVDRLAPEEMADLSKAIPLSSEDQLATVEWLLEGNPKDEVDSLSRSLLGWTAWLQERVGDTEGAIATYRAVPSNWRVQPAFDEAMIRLTGEPLGTETRQDKWVAWTEKLGSLPPGDPVFGKLIDEIDSYLWYHRRGARNDDDAVLGAVIAATKNEGVRGAQPPVVDENGALLPRLGLWHASLLLARGDFKPAVPLLETALAAAQENDPWRAEMVISLAVAHAQISTGASEPGAERSAATALLVRAVEVEGYSDWARIRWFDDLDPIRGEPDYAALLKRHAREFVPSVASGPVTND